MLSYHYPLSVRDCAQTVLTENVCDFYFGLSLWLDQRQRLAHDHTLQGAATRLSLPVLSLSGEFSAYAVDRWISLLSSVCYLLFVWCVLVRANRASFLVKSKQPRYVLADHHNYQGVRHVNGSEVLIRLRSALPFTRKNSNNVAFKQNVRYGTPPQRHRNMPPILFYASKVLRIIILWLSADINIQYEG